MDFVSCYRLRRDDGVDGSQKWLSKRSSSVDSTEAYEAADSAEWSARGPELAISFTLASRVRYLSQLSRSANDDEAPLETQARIAEAEESAIKARETLKRWFSRWLRSSPCLFDGAVLASWPARVGGHPLRLEMVLTNRYLRGAAVVALAGGLAVFWHVQPDDAPIKQLAAWQRLASPGDLSSAHGRLEGDCGACHTPVMGASPTKCIACHATEERLLIWVRLFWNGGFGMSHSGKGSSHLTRLRWRPLTGTTLPSA